VEVCGGGDGGHGKWIVSVHGDEFIDNRHVHVQFAMPFWTPVVACPRGPPPTLPPTHPPTRQHAATSPVYTNSSSLTVLAAIPTDHMLMDALRANGYAGLGQGGSKAAPGAQRTQQQQQQQRQQGRGSGPREGGGVVAVQPIKRILRLTAMTCRCMRNRMAELGARALVWALCRITCTALYCGCLCGHAMVLMFKIICCSMAVLLHQVSFS
jgi:hypothetical protein